MKIAIIASNRLSLQDNTKKGTEIITREFIQALVKENGKDLEITAFASGDSDLPIKIESIAYHPSSDNKFITKTGKHVIFELALLSKAFSQQDKFDLFHVHIGDGDIVIPFATFVKKPILITQYHPTNIGYAEAYFSPFMHNKNIFFVAPTNIQREKYPFLRYIATIYHGIDTKRFAFNPKGGKNIMWAGRMVPEKGMDMVLEVARRQKYNTSLFGIPKTEHKAWSEDMQQQVDTMSKSQNISLFLNKDRYTLIDHFQQSKLFLFPIQWEEPFGLVVAESMSCGTPVVAFARGALSEIVEDGVTGFLINPSDNDIRGNFMIKKTGIDGLVEAVERIYGLSENDYTKMRYASRARIEKYFSANIMAKKYSALYKEISDTYTVED